MSETEVRSASPVLFDQIIGHETQVRVLKTAQLGQAYLFSGPSGVGKKLIALATAQRILCEHQEQGPCGKCPSCAQVKNFAHPDMMIVRTPEAVLKIDMIRHIQNFINLRSFKNNGKVVIIDDAQKMNVQAANALLKSLEEPPDGCHFILVSSSRGAILPTIQSRCQKINFGGLSDTEIKQIMPDAPFWAIPLCQGRLDLLSQWLDEGKKNLRFELLSVFKNVPHAPTFEGFEKMGPITDDRDTALFAVQLWQHWLRQLLGIKLGVSAQGSDDEIGTFEDLATHYSSDALIDLGQKILVLERDLSMNVNRKLAFENFWINMKNALTENSQPSKELN